MAIAVVSASHSNISENHQLSTYNSTIEVQQECFSGGLLRGDSATGGSETRLETMSKCRLRANAGNPFRFVGQESLVPAPGHLHQPDLRRSLLASAREIGVYLKRGPERHCEERSPHGLVVATAGRTAAIAR